jgi:hypothetical protein
MGITTKTITICCCDVCGSECVPEDGEVRVQVNSGDRDVGPAHIRGVLVFDQPYGCTSGIVCRPCKLKWLAVYLEREAKTP